MHGNLLVNRITDKKFQEEWHLHLAPLYASLRRLNELRFSREEDPNGMRYLEAAMEFIEARDAERNYFWDTFIRKEHSSQADASTTQKIKTPSK